MYNHPDIAQTLKNHRYIIDINVLAFICFSLNDSLTLVNMIMLACVCKLVLVFYIYWYVECLTLYYTQAPEPQGLGIYLRDVKWKITKQRSGTSTKVVCGFFFLGLGCVCGGVTRKHPAWCPSFNFRILLDAFLFGFSTF